MANQNVVDNSIQEVNSTLLYAPYVLKNTVQSLLCRQFILANNQNKLAEWHLYFTRKNMYERHVR